MKFKLWRDEQTGTQKMNSSLRLIPIMVKTILIIWHVCQMKNETRLTPNKSGSVWWIPDRVKVDSKLVHNICYYILAALFSMCEL